MADVAAAQDEDFEETGPKKSRLARFKKIGLFAGIPLLALVLSLGGAYMLGVFSPSSDSPAVEAPREAAFYNVPAMTVNLSSTERRAHYLKIEIALELKNKELAQAINPLLPRIMDAFQTYLRELRTSDLEGSAAVYRLKEELLRRVNDAIYPAQVERVLFKEILVQ